MKREKHFDINIARKIAEGAMSKAEEQFRTAWDNIRNKGKLYFFPYITVYESKLKEVVPTETSKLLLYLNNGYIVYDYKYSVSHSKRLLVRLVLKKRKLVVAEHMTFNNALASYLNSAHAKERVEHALNRYFKTIPMLYGINVDCAFMKVLEGKLDFKMWLETKLASQYC